MKPAPIMSAAAQGPELRLLKVSQIIERLAISRASWWRLVKAHPELLKPVKIGRNTTRWYSSSVEAAVAVLSERHK